MYCCRSTPTVPPWVVSTDWHPQISVRERKTADSAGRFMEALNVSWAPGVDTSKPLAFQGIGKKESRQREDRRQAVGQSRPRHLPGPAGQQGADRAAGAVADA